MAEVKHLYQLVYASACTGKYTREELNEILKVSRRNNEKLGITGILLYHDGSIIQVLEGEKETVEYLYNTISKDSRHTKVKVLWAGPVREREFSEWTMGLVDITEKLLEQTPDLSDLLTNGEELLDLSKSDARRLVGLFGKLDKAKEFIE